MFTYKRPNEISSTAGESFLAEGPTNEILDVYVSLNSCLDFVSSCFSGPHLEQINNKYCPRSIRPFERRLLGCPYMLGIPLCPSPPNVPSS